MGVQQNRKRDTRYFVRQKNKMTDKNNVIALDHVTKIYKLFKNDKKRFLATFIKSVTYKEKRAINDVSFSVKKGESVALFGRNGAGKSTTMKMICGMIRPTAGEVRLFDRLAADPSGSAEYSEAVRIGALVESPGLYPNMTAFDNMRCKAIALGIVDDVGEIEQLLSVVGLGTAVGKPTEN